VKITQEVRAFALEQAGRRCECTGENCRHHLRGARCKRGLRGDDQWKVYWKSESGGLTRGNIQAWCLECFANNYEAPRETVALLAAEVAGYALLIEEDRRRAITLKSVLRDAADRAAKQHHGRMVLDRLDDDVLVEFRSSPEALQAMRSMSSGFQEIARRLDLVVPGISGAIHCGEVTRWRNGFLRGDAVDITMSVRGVAGLGRIVVTEPAVAPLKGSVELEPFSSDAAIELPVGGMWTLQL
jgi:class 3 adenylate cyclase